MQVSEDSFLHYFKIPMVILAIPVEQKGHDWEWGTKAEDLCQACTNHEGCKQKICVASEGFARTFESVCTAMEEYHDKKQIVTILIALGDCADLLSVDGNQ